MRRFHGTVAEEGTYQFGLVVYRECDVIEARAASCRSPPKIGYSPIGISGLGSTTV
jgi:hypothetical protein